MAKYKQQLDNILRTFQGGGVTNSQDINTKARENVRVADYLMNDYLNNNRDSYTGTEDIKEETWADKISDENLAFLRELYNNEGTALDRVQRFMEETNTTTRGLNPNIEYFKNESQGLNYPVTNDNLNVDYIELNEAIVEPNSITNTLSKDNLNYLRDVKYANEWITHPEAVERFTKETGVGYAQLNDWLNKHRQELRDKPLDSNLQKYIAESSLRYLQDELYKDLNLSDTEAVNTYLRSTNSTREGLNKNIEFDIQERRRNGITSQPDEVSKYQNIIEGTKKKAENNVRSTRGNSEISNNSRTQEDSETHTDWQQKALAYEQAENEKLARRIAKSSEDIINSPEHAQLISELSQQSRDEWNTNPNKEQDVRSKRANVIRSLENREPTEEELDQYVNTLKGIKKIGGFIKKFQGGGRNNTTYAPKYEFAAVNPDAWLEYQAQRYNDKTKSYDGVDINKSLSYYEKYLPTVYSKYFQNDSGNYRLKESMRNKDFQEGYNEFITETGELFKDSYGFSEADINDYINNINFTDNSENTSRGIDDKDGRYYYTRSGFTRKVLTPEQLKQLEEKGIYTGRGVFENEDVAKGILGDDVYNEVVKGLDKYKNADYILGTKESEKEDDAAKDDVDPNDGLENYRDKKSNYTETRPTLTPDQSNLSPRYFGTRMRSIRSPWNVANYVSPNATVREISRQGNTARRLLNSTNPYTSAAAIANMQGQENDAIMNAVMTAEMTNQQTQNQTDMVNEDRVNKTDSANMSESLNYELRSNQGQDAYYKEWMNYIDRRNQERLVNYNMQNQVNAINAMHPNYNVNAFGQIAQTDEPFIITAESGVQYIIDPRTNKVTKINKEEKSDKKKPDTKKNGGTLRDFLKSNRKKG